MTVDTKAKPRPVITTVWPANQAKCSTRKSKELGRDLGSSSDGGARSKGSSFSLTCGGLVSHQQMGQPDCRKLSDLNGNTGVAFSNAEAAPLLKIDFEIPAQFTGVWHYVHPQLHRKRQLKRVSVYCHHGAKATKVALLSIPHDAKDGWNFLPFDRQCPEKSNKWQFKNMAAEAPVFYVMDLLLGSNAKGFVDFQ